MRSKVRRRLQKKLAEMYGDQCYYCQRDFEAEGKRARTLDHLTPVSKDGTDDLQNLALCCSSCNRAKGDLTWWEYVQTQGYRDRKAGVERERQRSYLKPEILTTLEVAV